ncbi:MAG: hypothetical protein ACOX4M_04010 [Acetivibrionales bacterium]|jgi:xylan 1,4-beta-xylosidase
MIKIKVPPESGGAVFRDTWKKCVGTGRPRFPDKGMAETLRQAARPLPVTGKPDASGGEIDMKITLSGNEVTLIELFAANDETHTCIGLDDSHIGY